MTHTGTGLGNPRWPDRRTLAHRRLARKTIIPHQPRDGTDLTLLPIISKPRRAGRGRRTAGTGVGAPSSRRAQTTATCDEELVPTNDAETAIACPPRRVEDVTFDGTCSRGDSARERTAGRTAERMEGGRLAEVVAVVANHWDAPGGVQSSEGASEDGGSAGGGVALRPRALSGVVSRPPPPTASVAKSGPPDGAEPRTSGPATRRRGAPGTRTSPARCPPSASSACQTYVTGSASRAAGTGGSSGWYCRGTGWGGRSPGGT